MQPTTPPISTIEYVSPPTTERTPKLWVLIVLVVVHFFGIGCGFHVWYYLNQAGKDPLAQLYECGPIGFAIAAVLYGLYFRRSWRLTMAAVVLSFVLGASTGLAAVGLHIHQVGWHPLR